MLNFGVLESIHNKKILMKILIPLTILVVISVQSIVDLPFHNPLKDRSFSISYNLPESKNINGVEVYFTGSRISFKGCNSNWASYTIKGSGQFSITSSWSSTDMACPIDQDNQIRNLFSNATKVFELTIGRVDFINGPKILLILIPKQAIQPFNSQTLAGKTLIIQQTSLGVNQIIGISVSFTQNVISFTGCNKNTASYSTGAYGRFNIDSIWFGTLRGCDIDYDSSITRLFSSSIRYAFRSDGGVDFFDQKSVLIKLGPKPPIMLLNSLQGKNYIIAQTSLNNDKIIGYDVRFTKQILSFRGCNINFASYSVGDKNKFSVDGQWAATRIFCLVDFDKSVRQLFSKSKSFEVCKNGSITFFDQKSKLTISLNIKQQIRPLQSLQLNGGFKISWNSLGVPAINGVQVNFDATSVSFRQCNRNRAGYYANVFKAFAITSIWMGTGLGCLFPDYDREILSLFNSATTFDYTTNGLVFFDNNSRLLLQLTSR